MSLWLQFIRFIEGFYDLFDGYVMKDAQLSQYICFVFDRLNFTVVHIVNTFRTNVGHGLREEAIEFARCFRAGEKESPMLPLDETLSIMGTITEIANQIGLKFEKFAQ